MFFLLQLFSKADFPLEIYHYSYGNCPCVESDNPDLGILSGIYDI